MTKNTSRLEAVAILLVFTVFFCSCAEEESWVTVTSPANGASVTTLPGISGEYSTGKYGGLTDIRVTLLRHADGKYWNGTTWGGGSSDLPGTFDDVNETWQLAAGTALPVGSGEVSGLAPGYYFITTHATFDGTHVSQGDCVFSVGVTAPPVMPTPWAWGDNDSGQLGAGAVPDSNLPLPVFTRGALEGKILMTVAAGHAHSLALATDGVYSWGGSALGAGSAITTSSVPVAVDLSGALSGKMIAGIAAGGSHSLAVSTDGLVYAWGTNYDGQLGNNTSGTSAWSDVPVAVVSTGVLAGKKIISISAGAEFSMARSTDGKLFAWGDNMSGQLGTGTNVQSNVPVAVTGLTAEFISEVECGRAHSLARTDTGKVFAWGKGLAGRIGTGTTADAPTPVQILAALGGRKIVSVSAGGAHSLAADDEGKVYAWGENDRGQLGTGDGLNHLTPVQVTGALAGLDVVQVYAGEVSSMAITRDNKVYCWGSNDNGQLAAATPLGADTDVPLLADVSAALSGGRVMLGLAAGEYHAVMLTGFQPARAPEIEVEAQGSILNEGDVVSISPTPARGYRYVEILVRNTGKADLTDLNVTVDGPDSGVFYYYLPGDPLPAGETATLELWYEPDLAGSHTANVHLFSNDADESPFTVVLEGTAYRSDELDPAFADAGIVGAVRTTALEPDGQILIGGAFTTVTGSGRNHIARLYNDGSLDASFNPNVDGDVNCIVVQPDGKIVIAGAFTSVGGTARNRIARLNADGTLDTAFDPNAGSTGQILGMALQGDGKVIIAGSFTSVGGIARNYLARLGAEGSLDGTFDPVISDPVNTVAIHLDGRILIGGPFLTVGGASHSRIARLQASGAVDATFNAQINDGDVYCITISPTQNRMLVGGSFINVNGAVCNRLCLLKSDGVLHPFFVGNVDGPVRTIALQTGEDFIIGGDFTSVNGAPRHNMAGVYGFGGASDSLMPEPDNTVNSISLQADGKVLAAGTFTHIGLGGAARSQLARMKNQHATQELSVPDLTSIDWKREGASPVAYKVFMDLSTNGGASWTPLGPATFSFSSFSWTLPGLNLPATGQIRAQALCAGGHQGGASSVFETITTYGAPPEIEVTASGGVTYNNGDTHHLGVVATGSGASNVVFTIQNTGTGNLKGLSAASIAGPGAGSYQIVQMPADPVIGGGSTFVSVTFSPRSTGTQIGVLSLPSNDADESPFLITLDGFGGEPITTWKQRFFGTTTNSGSAADNADPDGDGVTNLEEYARGLNPLAAGSSDQGLSLGGASAFAPNTTGEAAAGEAAAQTFFFTYGRNKLALSDILFQVEWSDTLGSADWHTTDVTEQVLSESQNLQQVQATVPAGTSGRRFVRLKMTRP